MLSKSDGNYINLFDSTCDFEQHFNPYDNDILNGTISNDIFDIFSKSLLLSKHSFSCNIPLNSLYDMGRDQKDWYFSLCYVKTNMITNKSFIVIRLYHLSGYHNGSVIKSIKGFRIIHIDNHYQLEEVDNIGSNSGYKLKFDESDSFTSEIDLDIKVFFDFTCHSYRVTPFGTNLEEIYDYDLISIAEYYNWF